MEWALIASPLTTSTKAALRYALGDDHTYEFVQGVLKTSIHSEIQDFFPQREEYFEYFDLNDVSSCQEAVRNLEDFIATEGPFDGVIGFSQGAALAAAVMAQRQRKQPLEEAANPVFKCAIFISAAVVFDPISLGEGFLRALSWDVDGEVVHVPTTHIWGQKDPSPFPPILAKLCNTTTRQVYIHDGGHGIPGSHMGEALGECVRVIRRSILTAKLSTV
ncbi:unnamed protein product [Clonostachys rhizophaga]|uniref:Serine hydrolase domain-containing protein n=1 Tax=Clonostachys rhizophaga TaxID=160324 RepID=A0A9N9VFM0_9HYPO|nr:unnamed protein product [Clonostachys rhizophaga]